MINNPIVGIFSSLGVPPRYGGFETLAWHLSKYLSEQGCKVLVQTMSGVTCSENEYIPNGVIPVYFSRGESLLGDVIYDVKAFARMAKRVNVALVLGYGSAPFLRIFKHYKVPVILHTGGMEWQRPRFNKFQKRILKCFERVGVKSADHLIVDSPIIKAYMDENYATPSTLIAYGAETFSVTESDLPFRSLITPNSYFLFIARLEPSTSVDYILEEYIKSRRQEKLLLVGPVLPSYKRRLESIAAHDSRIIFTGGFYGNQKELFALRRFACSYINGNRTGGTPPSLIEALSAGRHIIAHNNPHMHAALGDVDASYYDYVPGSLCSILNDLDESRLFNDKNQSYIERYESMFTWPKICQCYHDTILKVLGE